MNVLRSLVTKRAAYESLKHDVSNGLGHAYILVCEDAAARNEFIIAALQRMFCSRGCGECKVCRAIEDGNFPECSVLDGSAMKSENMTDLTERAQIKPILAERKVFVIDNAEKLTPTLQNKMLKTYEEPPEFLTILLTCSDLDGILPTIKSRAKILYFDAFTSAEVTEYLVDEGYDEENARIAAAVGGGSVAKSEAYLSDEAHIEQYDACFDLLKRLNSSSDVADFLYSDLFTKENVLLTLEFLEIILCDVLNIAAKSGVNPRNTGREFDLETIAKKFTPQSAAMSLCALSEGRKKIESNMSAVTAAEKILFDILEARYKWQ